MAGAVEVAEQAWLYSEDATTNQTTGSAENGDDLAEEVVGSAPATGEVGALVSGVDEDEDSDDEGVNVIVNRGPSVPHAASSVSAKGATTPYQAKSAPSAAVQPSKQTKTIDLAAPGNIQGVATTDYNLTSLPDSEKPWKQPGSDITDYFNYGFTEETWVAYAEKQRALRGQYGSLAPVVTNPIRAVGPPVYRPRMPQPPYQPIFRPRLQPEMSSGAISVIGSTPNDSRRPRDGLEVPPGGIPVPVGPPVPGGPVFPPAEFPFPGTQFPPPGFPPFGFAPPVPGIIPGHPGFAGPWGAVYPHPAERTNSPSSMRSDEDYPEMVAAPPPDGMEPPEPQNETPQPIGYPGSSAPPAPVPVATRSSSRRPRHDMDRLQEYERFQGRRGAGGHAAGQGHQVARSAVVTESTVHGGRNVRVRAVGGDGGVRVTQRHHVVRGGDPRWNLRLPNLNQLQNNFVSLGNVSNDSGLSSREHSTPQSPLSDCISSG